MKKQAVELFLVLGCVSVLASGCTKKEMVRPGEPLVPAAAAASVAGSETGRAETPRSEAVLDRPVLEALKPESAPAAPLAPLAGAELAALLEKIHFDFDSYTLSAPARDTLVKNAQLLQQAADKKLRIAGHCDERGSDDYNLALSERRARAARQYLIALGVAEERLSVLAYGKEKPAAPGHDEAAWAENRRDEFEIVE